jgi:hypothetical protein
MMVPKQEKISLSACCLRRLTSGDGWNDHYLYLCMQGKGFVVDSGLTWDPNAAIYRIRLSRPPATAPTCGLRNGGLACDETLSLVG